MHPLPRSSEPIDRDGSELLHVKCRAATRTSYGTPRYMAARVGSADVQRGLSP